MNKEIAGMRTTLKRLEENDTTRPEVIAELKKLIAARELSIEIRNANPQ